MRKSWIMVGWGVLLLVVFGCSDVTAAYANYSSELDQQRKDKLIEKYGLEKPEDPPPRNLLLDGDWGISFKSPIERYKMAISTIQSIQQPITFIIRLLV
ncbi:hypothetical protein P4H27_15000 [Paenibacillus taichungensis]|uniref:hypothetical protein n=1 Tax=Paenibacillus TaxID=44249 RepID=UPI00096C5C97|nr:hypothetical protein [Paenibacillus taichungensis]MEC0108265.1 hypothetical protein [Paenibacillus taichungensis]MEC0199690.1 hypothetical protein [Paenibacillus taichungensis]OME84761.1 hypothetical protein BK122_06450 [Paenibacillus pabuli]